MRKQWTVCLLLILLSCNGCGVVARGVVKGYHAFVDSELFHRGRHGALTEEEGKWAKAAWNYFKNNTQSQTGIANAVDYYPSSTVWQMADYLAALVSAHELEVIGREEFDQRLSQLLHFLNTMHLFQDKLPNKAYNTQTGAPANYENKPGEIGWSAIDIGRLLTWLAITKSRYPAYGEYIGRIVLRWHFCDVVDKSGTLYSGMKKGERVELYRERLAGYDRYAAKGFELWGFDIKPESATEAACHVQIYGIDIPYDTLDQRERGDFSPLCSLGFLLDGMEFNWNAPGDLKSGDRRTADPGAAKLAEDIYKVQEARYLREGIFTARTDHQLPQAPFFVYDSIFAAGYPWNVISDDGRYQKDAAAVSTKAAFGMWVLWKTPYTDALIGSIGTLFDPERGWYEGRLERTGGYLYVITAGTNAAVLEALFYKTRGRLLGCGEREDYYSLYMKDPFKAQGHCYPPEAACR